MALICSKSLCGNPAGKIKFSHIEANDLLLSEFLSSEETLMTLSHSLGPTEAPLIEVSYPDGQVYRTVSYISRFDHEHRFGRSVIATKSAGIWSSSRDDMVLAVSKAQEIVGK